MRRLSTKIPHEAINHILSYLILLFYLLKKIKHFRFSFKKIVTGFLKCKLLTAKNVILRKYELSKIYCSLSPESFPEHISRTKHFRHNFIWGQKCMSPENIIVYKTITVYSFNIVLTFNIV